MHSREFQKTLEFITFCVVLQKGINKKTWTFFVIIRIKLNQPAFTCPKVIIETVKQDVKYVQS